MNFKGKKVLVIGLAKSGLAAIEALQKRGAIPVAYDAKTAAELGSNLDLLKKMDIELFLGKKPAVTGQQFDLVILSPAVSMEMDLVQEALKQGIKVISELELAYLIKNPQTEIIAVTGTNGKTTTTSLLQYTFAHDGRKSLAGGNIGVPLCSLVDKIENGIISVEASSFQLEGVDCFHPHISGILNITPDHLDRHKTMQAYTASKAKIFSRQNQDDFTILNYEDERVRNLAPQVGSNIIFFSIDRVLEEGVCIDDGNIVVNLNGRRTVICPQNKVWLRGNHNLENVLCAVGMCWAAGVSAQIIGECLQSFKGVRHRIEEVGRYNDVLYINDSKGTNPVSTIKALESFTEPIILIAGGRNKGSDFSDVATVIKDKVKALVLIGEAKNTIRTAVMDAGFPNINIYEADDLPSAVVKATELADSGDVVLLSPACASWDMFPSYEHRGDLFCDTVKRLPELIK